VIEFRGYDNIKVVKFTLIFGENAHDRRNRSAIAVENYVSETVFELQSNSISICGVEVGGKHFEYTKARLIKFRSWNLRRRSAFRAAIRALRHRDIMMAIKLPFWVFFFSQRDLNKRGDYNVRFERD